VGGAILAATLANVVVFAPLVLVTGEVSQLFVDMAITITAAAVLSMFASLTLLPMLASLFFNPADAQQTFQLGTSSDSERQVQGNWLERSIMQTFPIAPDWQKWVYRNRRSGGMVEAALGGRFASEFVDGKEELDVMVQLQNVFVKTPEQFRQLSL
jgi:multidrug efflux pump subunit AcrB